MSQADLYLDPDPQQGGHLVARQLDHLGVQTVFTIPGETFLSALDGLFDQPAISTVVCRHEGGATMMAEAWAKMTGMPGVAFVTRAPGLSNAISGLVVARQDQTPLLLLVGLPRTTLDNRSDLQVAEFEAMMGAVSKWSTIVRDPDRIAEVVARGYALAQMGRPGPVVIGFPEDTLNQACAADVVDPIAKPNVTPDHRDLETISTILESSQTPLILVGGPGWSRDVEKRVALFAQRANIPVIAAFRCQDYLDNRHPCYAGHAGIAIDNQVATAIRGADTILALGANLGDVTTGQYELIKSPRPEQTLVHVLSSEQQLSQSCTADVAIAVPMETFSAYLPKIELTGKPSWSAWRRDLRSAYERSLQPQTTPGDVQLPDVIALLSDMLPDDAIVTNGAGNYTQFLHRYFQYKGYRSCLAPASGSMGYGLPAAIAAQMAAPDKRVIAIAGDGCLMMTVQELATAVQYDLPIITIVVNNGMYGTIRMHQERRFPSRVIGTTLVNPDFCSLARSFGIQAETVSRTEQFEGALTRALESQQPTLIEVVIDAEAVAPDLTLSGLRHG